MKKALILHGTNSSSSGNWFPWLKQELEKRGWKVWVPDLPHPEAPNIARYNEYIFASDFVLDTETLLIGHSSGAVAILGLLGAVPEDTCIKQAILVGSFVNPLGREDLKGLFHVPFDFGSIRKRAVHFTFIHSDDDPHCPLSGAQYLARELGGTLVVLPGQKHFSIGTAGESYRKFPFLLDVIEGA
ncbi:MAG: alpha/beta fold hydrolase [Patescibacteria group bacterium]|nr:alpha/beta fold hydrolase [Patescibacteria group bacterium]